MPNIEVTIKKVSEIVMEDVEASDVAEAVSIVKKMLLQKKIEFIDDYDDVTYSITARKYDVDGGVRVEQKEVRVYA